MNYTRIELKKQGQCLQAALFAPEMKEGEKYPLVLFLHGAGERGTDITKITTYKGPDMLTSNAWQKEHPSFVLMPQCPERATWSDFIELLVHTLSTLPYEYAIDACRIYVTGLSMGGGGTWKLITRCPHRVAAAMPICGYADPALVRAAKHVPVWAFHAADDDIVPATGVYRASFDAYRSPENEYGVGSRQVVSALRSAGGREVHYTEYPAGHIEDNWKMGPHASWLAAYDDKEALEWMFSKSRYDRYDIKMIRPGVFHIEDFDRDAIYLVEGREKALLIDTGMGGPGLTDVVKNLTALPVELAVTHAHGDHMALTHLFGKFYMSKKDIPLMERMHGMMPENTSTLEDVIDIKDGDVIDLGGVQIEVAELGGHTPGSVVFIDRTHNCMFTGDALGLWMQVPMALPISEYKAQLIKLQKKLEQPGYTELAFLGGHKWQEGGEYTRDAYVPNSYEKVTDMIHLCSLLLTDGIEVKSFPMNFGEPSFEATYQTANMVFKKSVVK